MKPPRNNLILLTSKGGPRSTRTQKSDRLRAARRLLADGTGMVEAAVALSREFGLSRRQAYRYLGPPASGQTCSAGCQELDYDYAQDAGEPRARSPCPCERARRHDERDCQAGRNGFPGGKAPAWLSTGRCDVPSISSSHSIGCSLPSSNWLTTFWFLIWCGWSVAQS